jgi:hypothetical protein
MHSAAFQGRTPLTQTAWADFTEGCRVGIAVVFLALLAGRQ